MASFLFLLNDGYGRRGLVIIASSKSLSAIGQTCPLLRNRDLRTSSWRSLTKDESMSRPRHPFETFSGQPSWLGSQCLLQSNVICSYQWHCCKKSRVSSVISTDKRNPPLFAISSTARRSPPFFPFSRIVGQSDDYSQISGEKFIVIQSLLWHHWSETYIQRLSPL